MTTKTFSSSQFFFSSSNLILMSHKAPPQKFDFGKENTTKKKK